MQTDEICSDTAALFVFMFGPRCTCSLAPVGCVCLCVYVCTILLGSASVTQVTELPPPSPLPPPLSLPFIFMFSASVVFSSAEAGRQCDRVRERERKKRKRSTKGRERGKERGSGCAVLFHFFVPRHVAFGLDRFTQHSCGEAGQWAQVQVSVCVWVCAEAMLQRRDGDILLTYWWANLFLISGPTPSFGWREWKGGCVSWLSRVSVGRMLISPLSEFADSSVALLIVPGLFSSIASLLLFTFSSCWVVHLAVSLITSFSVQNCGGIFFVCLFV